MSYLQHQRDRKHRGQRGFTLVELVVVLVILAVMAAIAIPAFTSIERGAQDKAGEEILRSVGQRAQSLTASDDREQFDDQDINKAVTTTPDDSSGLAPGIIAAQDAKFKTTSGVSTRYGLVSYYIDPTDSKATGMAMKSKSGGCIFSFAPARGEVVVWHTSHWDDSCRGQNAMNPGSDPDPEDAGPPDAPIMTCLTQGDSMVSLLWTHPEANDVAGYRLYQDTSKIQNITDPTNTTANVSELENDTSYSFYVIAYDQSDHDSDASNSVPCVPGDTTPPTAPTRLLAVGGERLVNLTWTASFDDHPSGYRVYRGVTVDSTDPTSDALLGIAFIATGISNTNYTDADPTLVPGTMYRYVVVAYDISGNASPASNTADAIPFDSTAPPTPTNITADGAVRQIQVTWDPVEMPAVGDFVSYVLYRDGVKLPLGVITGTSYLDGAGHTLGDGETHTYRVSTLDATGNESSQSDPASATTLAPPATPTGLAATGGVKQVSTAWDPSAGADNYDLQRVTPATEWDGLSNTALVDDELADATTYTYRVRACSAADGWPTHTDGCSAWSAPVSATTQAAATSLTATPNSSTAGAANFNAGDSQWIMLNSALSNTGNLTLEALVRPDTVTGPAESVIAKRDVSAIGKAEYEMYINPSGGTLGFRQAQASSSSATSGTICTYSTVMPVTSGTWYHLAVVRDSSAKTIAFYINGVLTDTKNYTTGTCAGMPNIVSTPRRAAIGAMFSTPSGTNDAVSGAATNFFDGRIEEAAIYSSVLTAGQIATHNTIATTGASQNSTSYSAAVTSLNPAGYWRLGETSGTSAVDSSGHSITGTYCGGNDTSCSGVAPALYLEGGLRGKIITLNWPAVSGAYNYRLYRGGSYLTSATGTSYVDTSLAAGTTYSYTIQACSTGDISSCGSLSAPASALTLPAAPTNLAVTATGTTVTATWHTVTTATSYNLSRSKNGGSWTANSSNPFTGVAGTAYSYKIGACNSTGCSGFAGIVTATTIPPTPSEAISCNPTWGRVPRNDGHCAGFGVASGATTFQYLRAGMAVFGTDPGFITANASSGSGTAASLFYIPEFLGQYGVNYTFMIGCNAAGCSNPTLASANGVPQPGSSYQTTGANVGGGFAQWHYAALWATAYETSYLATQEGSGVFCGTGALCYSTYNGGAAWILSPVGVGEGGFYLTIGSPPGGATANPFIPISGGRIFGIRTYLKPRASNEQWCMPQGVGNAAPRIVGEVPKFADNTYHSGNCSPDSNYIWYL